MAQMYYHKQNLVLVTKFSICDCDVFSPLSCVQLQVTGGIVNDLGV